MEKFRKHEPYFINVFRHGLTHQYFAKGGGISRGEPGVIYFSPKFGLILDADRFAEIFIKSTKNFKNLFRKKKWKIKYPNLPNQVYERFIKSTQQTLYKTIKI